MTSVLPRAALEAAICQDVPGDDYTETFLAWRSPIDVFTGSGGATLTKLVGCSAIDPLTGAHLVRHSANAVNAQITLSGIRPAPWAKDVGFTITGPDGVDSAVVTIDHQIITLTSTLDGEPRSYRYEFRALGSWTIGEAVAWITAAAAGWTAELDDDADEDWEMRDAVRIAAAPAMSELAIQVIHSIAGHAEQGTMESVTTVALGGSIVVFNTDGKCPEFRESGGLSVPGPRVRSNMCAPPTVGCPSSIWDLVSNCQRDPPLPGHIPCVYCITTGDSRNSECTIEKQGQGSNTYTCNALGIGGRQVNPYWGLRMYPDETERPLDLSTWPWHTQFGLYDPDDPEAVPELATDEVKERFAGGTARYYPGSFRVEVCPCHNQQYCTPYSVWLCHWKITNGWDNYRLECNGPWSPDRWPGIWIDDEGNPRPETDKRPIEVLLDAKRQLVFVDLSLNQPSSPCFPLNNQYCFTHHAPAVIPPITDSVGDTYPHMVTALEWLALDFDNLRFTDQTGPGERYPQHTPATMQRRSDILHCYTSYQEAIGPTTTPWHPLDDRPAIRPGHPGRPGDDVYPYYQLVTWHDAGLNLWGHWQTWDNRVVNYSSGDDAGGAIPITVMAYYSGREWPARLELSDARLEIRLNVETLNGPVGGGGAPPSDRFGATCDLLLTCRVKLTNQAPIDGLGFANSDLYDLTFDDPTEFAVVKGPEGERVPLTVRWRGVTGPYPYARGWDPRWNTDWNEGTRRLHGFEPRSGSPPLCCHAHRVIHGASIWAEVDRHEATVPDNFDDELEWPDQLYGGRIITWIPAMPIPGVWGILHYVGASYTCG